jgi:uncharacterized RDD family membrane protein YckC
MTLMAERSETPRRAGFWIRAAAAFVDVVVIYFITIALWLLYGRVREELCLGLVWIVYTSFEMWTARTLGKWVVGLTISSADAGPAENATLVLRWMTKQSGIIMSILGIALHNTGFRGLGGLLNLLVIIGCLVASGDDKQAWHDQWARTAVFRKRKVRPRGFEPVLKP